MRAVLLAAFAILVLVRMPEIVIKGRFWAEEGSVFFANAWAVPPWRALFTSYGGYLNLIANAATLAARLLLPLPLAPYLTIATGLAFQLLPPFLLLSRQDDWLAQPLHRFAGVLLLLLVPGTEEIWLQSLHCQFELTLCCGIILALRPPDRRGRRTALAILALAPLCGPGAIVLVPLFFARAVVDRSRARLLQALVLTAAGGLQLAVFYEPFATRAYRLQPVMLLSVVTVRHVVEPFFGFRVAYWIGGGVRQTLASGHVPIFASIVPVVLFVVCVVLLLRAPAAAAARWLFAAAVLLALASYYGAIGGVAILIGAQSGERYVFVPQALLGLAVLAYATTVRGTAGRVASVLVLWLIVAGAGTYVSTLRGIRNGPAWRAEIREWRRDPSHVIRLWPHGWSVRLQPHIAS